jgi:sugar phosphate isomerase/epimerase
VNDRVQTKCLTRRGFLSTTIAVTASAGIGSACTHSAWGIEPIRREGSSFKFSLAAYSYRQRLQGAAPELTLFDFVDDCAKFGLDATELTSYYFPANVTHDDLRQLRRHCFRQGLDISGTAVGNDFGQPPGRERDRELSLVRTWIGRAEILGAPVIRIFAGQNHDDSSPDELHRRIVSGIEECCEYAGKHGVHLALENHGGPTATADGLLELVHAVQSPWFGVNLDTGNFHTRDIYGDLQRVAPYAINVQVKATISAPDGVRHATDYERLGKILRGANYRGYIVLEYEDSGDPREQCPVHLERIRTAFGR